MRVDDLTMHDFGKLFKRLTLAYQRTVPAKEYEQTVEVYFETVQRYALPVIEQAVTKLISQAEGRYFPRAPDVAATCRMLVAETERQNGHQHHVEGDTVCCPGCRTAFYYAGYELAHGNVVGRRRCRCRQGGVGWDTDAARAWVDPGPRSYQEAKTQLRALLDQPEAPRRKRSRLVPIAAIIQPPANAGDAWEADVIYQKKAAFRAAAQPEEGLT